MSKRKWKRWVLMGKLSLMELVNVARKQGMVCICAFKMSMFVHNQIGLYGTSKQMKATEKTWRSKGHNVTNRKPSYAFSIDLNKPREEWADKQSVKSKG